MTLHNALHCLTAAALLAAVAVPAAQAQSGRLSLAERVAQLEQQVQGQGQVSTNVELLNRITDLQTELQALRNLVEQQTFEIESLKRRGRDQYIDLDSRLTRLEGGTAGAGAAASPPATDGASPAAAPVLDSGIAPPPLTAADNITAGGTGTAVAEPASPAVEPATATEPVSEQRAYEDAFDALKDGRYAEAARRFQSFLERFPQGEYAPNAQYWLGESYYVTQNYQIALDTFQTLLSRFPSSSKAPDALLKVGYCHYELRQWPQAEAVLNQVIQQYPDATVARLAEGRLRALRLENRQ